MTSQRKASVLAMLACLASICLAGNVAWADETHTVDFRLLKWKTIHLDDAKKAEIQFKTLKGLSCEVEKAVHGDHIDLKYRLTKWRTARFESHDEAHKWQNYFRGMGFETRHTH